MKKLILASILAIVLAAGAAHAADIVPSTIDQPGTQPQEISALSGPDRCDNCHGGYNTSVEPAFNWRGSMMANAGRDPIFWATVAVVEQDFNGAGDLCIRCHSTAGWLAGRSTPTDGSGLGQSDDDGVECDFCHKMTNPANMPPQNSLPPFEWAGVQIFPFIANDEPLSATGYYGSGMFSMWGGGDMLGPYADTNARHQFLKSKFHRDREFCGTCHDVSNPAVGNIAHNFGAQDAFLAAFPGSITADRKSEPPDEKVHDPKAAFNNFPYQYGIVERTFSEHMSSQIPFTLVDDFPTLPADLQGGALQAMYNAATKNGAISANYVQENPDDPPEDYNRYYTCQTCHLRPVTGQGCNKNPVVRDDLPLHDMTGGNYWMPEAIKYLDTQGKLLLGGNLTATQIAALDAGALRAKEQLDLAASLSVQGKTVKIVNHTGHKLISGYPEGRRMWLNIKWYDASGNPLLDANGDHLEYGKYGPITVTVDLNNDGTAQQVQVDTILDLYDPNTKIYEAHYGMTQEWAAQLMPLFPNDLILSYDRYTGAPDFTLSQLADPNFPGTYHETFHFALNNYVAKDNRIPPYGMSYDKALARNALPVPENQYSGGPGKTYDYFDTFHLNPPQGAASAIIDLLYQPTSYEYQLFLLKANPPDPLNPDFLDMEGQYMFEAWLNTGMAAPYVMASATWHDPTVPQCTATPPQNLSAVPSSQQVDVTWEAVPNPVDGYILYYDQAGKAQLVKDVGLNTTHTDTGLTNGQEYCYKVTSWYDVDGDGLFDPVNDCESAFSNIICAIADAPGQTILAGVTELVTGRYVVTGGTKKNPIISFEVATGFTAGEEVVIRATVRDESGLPLSGATVAISIIDPEPTKNTVANLYPTSDANGIAETTWQTQAGRRKNPGTTPGTYTAQVTNVTATGYSWDGVTKNTTFTIQ